MKIIKVPITFKFDGVLVENVEDWALEHGREMVIVHAHVKDLVTRESWIEEVAMPDLLWNTFRMEAESLKMVTWEEKSRRQPRKRRK